jgi:CubicO group peptidase (beta-lactamase class C family)
VEAYERASAAWPVDRQGYHYGAAGPRLPVRDPAKFGYLYLNGGRWDVNQLISPNYVAAATSPRGIEPTDGTATTHYGCIGRYAPLHPAPPTTLLWRRSCASWPRVQRHWHDTRREDL